MNGNMKKPPRRRPSAQAIIKGSGKYPFLHGRAMFYSMGRGTVVEIEAVGLPEESAFVAVHLHDGRSCSGNASDVFADAGAHLNFSMLGHPLHTGDFPALLNNDGYAWGAFYTDRFTPRQVIGYPIVIHLNADDYHTQPSGNSGEKIGCGIIRSLP